MSDITGPFKRPQPDPEDVRKFVEQVNREKEAKQKRTDFEQALRKMEFREPELNVDHFMKRYDLAHAPKPKDYACGLCGTMFALSHMPFALSRIPACCPVCMVKL